jgi:Rps23 Pro-64 3,4-dihydroxylase Tpa1-like proline 4-hydroxylase
MNIINDEKLKLLSENNNDYISNSPFPNIYFKDFFNSEFLKNVLNEFPNLSKEEETAKFKDVNQLKNASLGEALLGENTKLLIHYLNSEPFLNFLTTLTGIKNLLPDPTLSGGGYHEIKPGGFLKIHADFNKHPKYNLDRRLNLLIYLNQNWEEGYGGSFELWDKEMKNCVKKIPPKFNNVAIFSTTSDSYHGHPSPLTCPPNRTRKSIALYYYTNGRPESEKIKFLEKHTTIFKAREEDKQKKEIEGYITSKLKKERKNFLYFNIIKLIKLFLPPIFVKIIKKIIN